jgi:hypothetical protein
MDFIIYNKIKNQNRILTEHNKILSKLCIIYTTKIKNGERGLVLLLYCRQI